MALSFTEMPLFGGAITSNVPSSWMDMSDIRQVPDNQECFIDIKGLATLIFEINERVEKENDEEAIKFHLSDIFEDSPYKVWNSRKLESGEIPGLPNVPAYTMLMTTPFVENRRSTPAHPSQFVALVVVIIRLEDKKTDIVITTNVPHTFEDAAAENSLCPPGYETEKGFADDYVWKPENLGPAMKNLLQIVEEGVKNFKIHDWNLFVTE
ncbi:multicopy suppressor of ts gsp1 [Orbilia ellipsospora]|uniref:Multicopy suppressor of ts gsp1 n=1 Tax=Orbilia ellipsospora TaxID=2528407 RepID=A0AAV9X3G0_9PEZI